ncbi:OmpA family protein [Hufsiella ginkgonis]|uniref:OmpA family protein n=1 Tax=Hufsiella ginkgonis TaxID=2695274 RepID=A0A7K1XUX8_9SPHI|nr:OmpA family protein [Hufsiella ginkgonis]MXV14296.1 OmpA family protein [Hufsiella ginkgonis]
MTFNLQKKEQPGGDQKKSTFDLSKKAATVAASPKRSNWPYLVVALLLAGGAVLYVANRDESHGTKGNHVTEAGIKPSAATEPNPPHEALTAASFGVGSAELAGIDEVTIKRIQSKLKSGRVKVEVHGYASSEGTLSLNQAISQARAEALKKVLVENGIPASAIKVTGMGIGHPVASNETEEGRRKNRRVEVIFVE